jgi:hypothetical protein
MSFVAITLCVSSQPVFIIVSIYFVIDSFRKILDTPSYKENSFLLFSVNSFAVIEFFIVVK